MFPFPVVGWLTAVAVSDSSAGEAIRIIEIVTALDVPALALLFAFAIWRGWLHTPRELDRMEKHFAREIRQRDNEIRVWKAIAAESLNLGESVLGEQE